MKPQYTCSYSNTLRIKGVHIKYCAIKQECAFGVTVNSVSISWNHDRKDDDLYKDWVLKQPNKNRNDQTEMKTKGEC